jgi:hypothetical protein
MMKNHSEFNNFCYPKIVKQQAWTPLDWGLSNWYQKHKEGLHNLGWLRCGHKDAQCVKWVHVWCAKMYGMSNSYMMVFIQEDSILHPFWIYLPFDLNTFHKMPLLWLLRNPLLNTPTYLPPFLITCHFVAFKKFILNITYLLFDLPK